MWPGKLTRSKQINLNIPKHFASSEADFHGLANDCLSVITEIFAELLTRLLITFFNCGYLVMNARRRSHARSLIYDRDDHAGEIINEIISLIKLMLCIPTVHFTQRKQPVFEGTNLSLIELCERGESEVIVRCLEDSSAHRIAQITSRYNLIEPKAFWAWSEWKNLIEENCFHSKVIFPGDVEIRDEFNFLRRIGDVATLTHISLNGR